MFFARSFPFVNSLSLHAKPQMQLQKLSCILMRLNKEKLKTPGNETWIKPSLVENNSLELNRNNLALSLEYET